MGFTLPDVVVESVIRDGLSDLEANPTKIDYVFADMLKAYALRKYGQAEIDRIKALIASKEIAVVHSFHEAAAKAPAFSIQLGSDMDSEKHAHLSDFEADIQEELMGADLDPFKKIDPLTPTAYDPVTGKVSVSDAVDMSLAARGYIYEDGDGTEFELIGGISNTTGNKFFFIQKGVSPNIIDPGLIKSFINTQQYEEKGVINDVQILVGVHSKEALLTKYLYILLKYFFLSRKNSLINRRYITSAIQGSDFTRDMAYQGDQVFTRFLTLKGRVEDTFRAEDVDQIDQVEIDADPVDC